MNNETTNILSQESENTQLENTQVENLQAEPQQKKESNVLPIAGGVVGGAILGAGGSFAAQELFGEKKSASKAEDDEDDEDDEKSEEKETEKEVDDEKNTEVSQNSHKQEPEHTTHHVAKSEVEPNDDNIHTASNNTPEVEILAVEAGFDEEGNFIEQAILTDGNDIAIVADLDGDGYADVAGIDFDHSGTFEANEIEDISGYNVEMMAYEQAYVAQNLGEDELMFASDDLPDYVNDAEVFDA